MECKIGKITNFWKCFQQVTRENTKNMTTEIANTQQLRFLTGLTRGTETIIYYTKKNTKNVKTKRNNRMPRIKQKSQITNKEVKGKRS